MSETNLAWTSSPTTTATMSLGAGGQRRGQRGGEAEAMGIGADGVDQDRVAGDIAAHHAKGLTQRAFDDVDLAHHAVAFGHAAAALAVHANRMDFVQIG